MTTLLQLPYKIELKDSVDLLKKKLTLSITRELNNRFFNEIIRNKIKLLFGEIIEKSIKNSTTYLSLKDEAGRLRAHLGIIDKNLIDNIIDIWKNSVNIVFNPGSGFLRIGETLQRSIIIVAIKIDFKDVLSTTSATYKIPPDENNAGTIIPWLEWILTQGKEIIVPAFTVVRGNFKSPIPSRTGHGIMVKSKVGWSVPQEFAGTIDYNFVTNAIAQNEAEFSNILERILIEGFI